LIDSLLSNYITGHLKIALHNLIQNMVESHSKNAGSIKH